MTIYFVDGKFMEREDLKISIEDRGYYFGDGVYEVIKVYGGELYTAEEHLDRLFQSATKIKLTIPYTEQQLMQMAKELAVANQIDTGHIYMQVTTRSCTAYSPIPGSERTTCCHCLCREQPQTIGRNGKWCGR